jgi:hypothetical protein
LWVAPTSASTVGSLPSVSFRTAFRIFRIRISVSRPTHGSHASLRSESPCEEIGEELGDERKHDVVEHDASVTNSPLYRRIGCWPQQQSEMCSARGTSGQQATGAKHVGWVLGGLHLAHFETRAADVFSTVLIICYLYNPVELNLTLSAITSANPRGYSYNPGQLGWCACLTYCYQPRQKK